MLRQWLKSLRVMKMGYWYGTSYSTHFPSPPPPPLLSAYPFMDSLHPFMSIFPICDMCSRIWNRRSDYVDFVNLCLFSAYLGTRSLKTFWSLVILILNYLNFSVWSVVYVKLQVISSFTFKCYWLEIRSVT